jgi:hypothetical protein
MAAPADPGRQAPGAARERRSGAERRTGERRSVAAQPALERRAGLERRLVRARRTKLERRETPEEHIRNALQLLANVADSGALTDELRRDLDSAMLRLRFAIDRLEQP